MHGSWFKESVVAALQRGVSGSIIPDWQILHEIVAGGGTLSSLGVKRIYDQLKEAGKAQEWSTIEEFEAYWRKEELQDPVVLPPSEGPQYNDRYIDAKWKQRAAKGEGKKRRRASKEDYKGKVRGVKQNKRFTSAMDIK